MMLTLTLGDGAGVRDTLGRVVAAPLFCATAGTANARPQNAKANSVRFRPVELSRVITYSLYTTLNQYRIYAPELTLGIAISPACARKSG
jgi:hypothetical protein